MVFVLLCLGPAIASLTSGPAARAATTYTITRNLPAGRDPTGVVLDLPHKRQFVQNSVLFGNGIATITAIDDVTGTVINTFPTAELPVDMAVDPVADRLYVLERVNATTPPATATFATGITVSQILFGARVEVFDATSHDLLFTIQVLGYVPNALAIDPARNRLYIAADPEPFSGNSTEVLAYDLGFNEIVRRYAISGSPTSVAVDPTTSRVYAVSTNPLSTPLLPQPGTLTVIEPDAERATIASVPVGVDPVDVSLDVVNGRAYIANATSESVSVVNLATNQPFRTVAVAGARQVAPDPTVQEVYVTGSATNNVTVLRAADLSTVATVSVAGRPAGVAVDATTQRAFVTTVTAGRLVTISRQTTVAPASTAPPAPVTTFPVPIVTTVPVVTTRAPVTTQAPTTVAPATVAPTTVAPTTVRPTTTLAPPPPPPATLPPVATTVARSQQAAAKFVDAVPSPLETRTEPGELAQDAFLAIVFLALLSLPINVVNGVAETNAELLAARTAGLGQRIPVVGIGVVGIGARLSNLPIAVVLVSAALVSALLYGFLQPSFSFDLPSLALILGVAFAVLIINAVQRLSQIGFLSRAFSASAFLRFLPGFVVVALGCVVISRIVGLQPGLLLGPLATVGLRQQLSQEDQGKALAVAYTSVAIFGVVAWFSRSTVLSTFEPGSFLGEVVGVALTTLVVACTETVAFNMIPLRFLDGSQVFAWSKAAWASLALFGVFGFVHVLVNPASGSGSIADRTGYLGILLVIYLALAAGFWAFFHFRAAASHEQPPAEPAPPGPRPPDQPPVPPPAPPVRGEDTMQAAWRAIQGSGWPTSRSGG